MEVHDSHHSLAANTHPPRSVPRRPTSDFHTISSRRCSTPTRPRNSPRPDSPTSRSRLFQSSRLTTTRFQNSPLSDRFHRISPRTRSPIENQRFSDSNPSRSSSTSPSPTYPRPRNSSRPPPRRTKFSLAAPRRRNRGRGDDRRRQRRLRHRPRAHLQRKFRSHVRERVQRAHRAPIGRVHERFRTLARRPARALGRQNRQRCGEGDTRDVARETRTRRIDGCARVGRARRRGRAREDGETRHRSRPGVTPRTFYKTTRARDDPFDRGRPSRTTRSLSRRLPLVLLILTARAFPLLTPFLLLRSLLFLSLFH